MVAVEYDNGTFYSKIGGDNFDELVDLLKSLGSKWNKEKKLWEVAPVAVKSLEEQATEMGETVEMSMFTEKKYKEFLGSLKELRMLGGRRSFRQELMNFPPLEGKHPNEKFQLLDILRAINQNRFLFNWRMGLGKSYTLAALIAHLRFYGDIDKCLIFSSNIGVLNLKQELVKFIKDLKPEDIIVFSSAGDIKYEDRDVFNSEKYPQKIIIMTYDFLKTTSNYYYDEAKGKKSNPHPSTKVKYQKNPMPIEKWFGGKPAGLFLDENHLLANPHSRRSKVFQFLLPYFDYRYLFTATLAVTYEKLYEPCMILDKDLVAGKSYSGWLADYNDIGTRFSEYAINPEGWRLDKIGDLNKSLLKSYASKRGQECLELPEHYIFDPFYVDMSPEQRFIYESFSNTSLKIFQEEAAADGVSLTKKVKNMFPYFQLAVDNPECIKDNCHFDKFPEDLQKAIKKFDYNKHSAKAKVIDSIVEDRVDEEGEKGIIWYLHPITGEALMKRYKKYNPVMMSAEVDKSERLAVVDEFLHNPKEKLIIASIKVMNTSVTLTECAFAVYAEKTYDYVEYDQSLGRIHRPGQDKTVRTYSVRYNSSIDNLQEQNLKSKGATLNALLNKEYIEHDLWRKLFSMQGDSLV